MIFDGTGSEKRRHIYLHRRERLSTENRWVESLTAHVTSAPYCNMGSHNLVAVPIWARCWSLRRAEEVPESPRSARSDLMINSISTGPALWLIQRLSAKPHSWAVRALSNRRCQPSISYQSSFWWKNVCTRSSRFLLKAYPNRTESIGIVYFSSIRIGLSIDYQTS